ncbi:hypothetical protein EW026_g2864 [Hermanssonia centrifuga]|uniref:MoaB/Mog domain-containing protein n=1 Tax=Hermanssonia centrifuga TaxID=98765 RepID=A0A4S4KLW8_9APHY|nr:hypothetical protein EW026_g2864 [Hermanssonia centrifuga]
MSSVPSETTGAAAPITPVQEPPKYNFPISEVPKNPLGEGRYIKTAAALIIGDEILNGKTLDRNSNYFARYCFERGVDLKRIEVIADDEDEMYGVRRSIPCPCHLESEAFYDEVSKPVGECHRAREESDARVDITYASLAKAFNQPLVHHAETLRRMYETRHRFKDIKQNEEQRAARERMALFPAEAEVLYTSSEIWVPVVRLEGKLCVFPGIPRLFQRMLDGLTQFLPLPPPDQRPFRQQLFTTRERKADGIRVGSYPLLSHGVYVSLIGLDATAVKTIAEEAVKALDGRLVSDEEAREIVKQKEKGAV